MIPSGEVERDERKRTVDERAESGMRRCQNRGVVFLRDEFGRTLKPARAASGSKAARSSIRLLHGTWEPVAPMQRERSKRANLARTRVPMRSTGAEQPVVGMKAL